MAAEPDAKLRAPVPGELQRAHTWSPPLKFVADDDGDRRRLAELASTGAITAVIDPIGELPDELYVCRRAGDLDDSAARDAFGRRFLEDAERFGVWVFFPWSGELVRYPEMEEHRSLRTLRHRNLITPAEQRLLAAARIAVFGLSVGSNVVDQFVQVGIGAAYLIGDMDRVTVSNLNRIRATMRHVGMTKVDVLARKISEVDPYIDQVHLVEGYGPEAEEQLAAFQPDLVVEEVDDLTAKARIRQWASKSRTPLLMVGDIGERSVVDVERHDLGGVRPFNGRVGEATFEKMIDGNLSPAEASRLLLKIVRPRNLSVRLLRSALDVGTELAGMPQLGSAAAAGAAVASVAARAIIGQETLRSGSYALSPRRTLKLGPQASPGEALDALRSLLHRLRSP